MPLGGRVFRNQTWIPKLTLRSAIADLGLSRLQVFMIILSLNLEILGYLA